MVRFAIAVGLLVVFVPLGKCRDCLRGLYQWTKAVREITRNLPKVG